MTKAEKIYKKSVDKYGVNAIVADAITAFNALTDNSLKFFSSKELTDPDVMRAKIADADIMLGHLKELFNRNKVAKIKRTKLEALDILNKKQEN